MAHDLHTYGVPNVEIPGTGCPAFLTSPSWGLIVIQEWWGMNVSITKTAQEFAALGFRCLVPDLYRGKVAKSIEEADHLMGGLDWGKAVEDIRAAAQYLKSQGCTKVGIVGFCMGGALVIVSCQQVQELDAGICFYGIPDIKDINTAAIKIPLLAFFGNQDAHKPFSDPETVNKLEEHLKAGGVNFEIIRYADAGHAFMNRDRPQLYKPELAAQARVKCGEFLKKCFS